MTETALDQTMLLATRPTLKRNEYQDALVRLGFRVVTADDDASCLEQLDESLPDVLVIEPELPLGGGDGVLEVVHEELAAHHIPVFVLTAEGNRSAIYRISRFTIGDFAIQPLAAQQFAARVRRLVMHRRSVVANGA